MDVDSAKLKQFLTVCKLIDDCENDFDSEYHKDFHKTSVNEMLNLILLKFSNLYHTLKLAKEENFELLISTQVF